MPPAFLSCESPTFLQDVFGYRARRLDSRLQEPARMLDGYYAADPQSQAHQ